MKHRFEKEISENAASSITIIDPNIIEISLLTPAIIKRNKEFIFICCFLIDANRVHYDIC